MAWNFRKRIKIAPGVHLNLSKGGVSTSFGPKGAKVTIGKKGTYLHTGIPGTGLYSRKKISGYNNKNKNVYTKNERYMENITENDSFFMPQNTWGCVFRWLGLIAIIFLIVNLVQLITGSFDNSKDNMTAVRFFGFIAAIFIIVYLKRFISFIKGFSSIHQKISPFKTYNAEDIKEMISSEKDDKRKTFLLGFETLCNKEKTIEKIRVGDDLTDKQRETYMKLSSAFDELCSCDKIWQIVSTTDNTEYRSQASYSLNRRTVRFSKEMFNNVRTKDIAYVPTFNAGVFYYFFYPQFIVRAKARNTTEFELFPISEVVLKYESHNFKEDPESSLLPNDSRIISFTYEKANMDGTPDLRFKYNKKLPIYQYGGINIEALKLKYMFSNAEKAKAFTESFAEHKAAVLCVSKEKESTQTTKERPDGVVNNLYGSHINDDESRKKSFGGATEAYFDKALKVTIPLYNFYKQIFQDKRIMHAMDAALKGRKNTSKETLHFLFLSDILTCYRHLGYDVTNLLTLEGLPMALLERMTLSESAITYPMIQMDSYKRIVGGMGVINKTVLDNLPKDKLDDCFYMDDVFKTCNTEDLRTQYFSLLYRFFSVIAKADDHISPEEGKWLEKLMFFSTTRKDYDLDAFEMKAPIDKKLTKKEQSLPKTNEEEVNPLEELQALIGLAEVKQEVSALSDFVKIQQEREKKGLKTVGLSYHCVFTGNPGTGKTTVARILAAIYKDLGILKKGHLVETDRSGLVAEYVGQTAVKTNKIIDSALDGVLFIDEAYSLVQSNGNDFGQEAISTLLKRMEDDRNRLIVVLAGYSDEMKRFIDSNPGLQSRFTRYIHFADYTAEELKQIFIFNVKKNQYTLEPDGEERLSEILDYAVEHKDKNFGNGRYVRNLFERTIQNQAIRLSCKASVTAEELSCLKAVDLNDNSMKEDNQSEERETVLNKRKPRLSLDMIFNDQVPNEDGKFIVVLTDGSGNEVKDANNNLITAIYIGNNVFECRGERGSSSYLAKEYLNMYAGKNYQTINGNEYWTYNGKELASLRKNQ